MCERKNTYKNKNKMHIKDKPNEAYIQIFYKF